MKRVNNLYDNMLSYESVYSVCKKIKSSCKNKRSVFNFFINYNTNVFNILSLLYKREYKFGKYNIFLIKDPKYRVIMSENINDKIVNHLVSKYILNPVIEKSLIDNNVATRINKGSGYAFKLFLKYVNSLKDKEEIYILKIDIKKYFYNIDHNICLDLLKKKIKCISSIKIIEDILNTTNESYINETINKLVRNEIKRINGLNISDKEKSVKVKELNSIPCYKKNKGLPIGNMTSQLLAVFYLNEVDRYIKEDLGLKFYIRYMDDLLIMSCDKEKLKRCFKLIELKINKKELLINNKSNIYKLSNGINFLGYNFKYINKLIIRYNNKTIRKIVKRLKVLKEKEYKKYKMSKGSYKGYISKCNTSIKGMY